MNIEYKINPKISSKDFIDILNRSGLAQRRPIEDVKCIEGMLKDADLIIIALHNKKIVGIARSVTDYNYCCYLSDLAVDKDYQKKGIGKKLIEITANQVGKKCKIILLSAPNAITYYPKIGFIKHPSAWILTKK